MGYLYLYKNVQKSLFLESAYFNSFLVKVGSALMHSRTVCLDPLSEVGLSQLSRAVVSETFLLRLSIPQLMKKASGL